MRARVLSRSRAQKCMNKCMNKNRQTIGFAATVQTLLALAAARSLTTALILSGGISTSTWRLHSTQMRLLEILILAVVGEPVCPNRRECVCLKY